MLTISLAKENCTVKFILFSFLQITHKINLIIWLCWSNVGSTAYLKKATRAATIFLLATLVCYSSHTTIRYSAYNLFVSAYLYSLRLQLHTRLIELLLTHSSALLWSFIVEQYLSNQRSWSRRFSFSPSRELYRDHIVIFTFVVVGLGVRCIY